MNKYSSQSKKRQPKVVHFNTIDPKADQYPGINPYLYCAGNPIMYVDPTGEITLKYFNDKEPNNLILIKGFDHIPDDYLHQINICAHGWPKGNLKRVPINLENGWSFIKVRLSIVRMVKVHQ